ncbi:hypothetical protein [Streptomyces lavendulocolor]|uniref:hypothetical protein n=1 Tax=Streptomyces lavendulocolor TaxID=67316 RepID=UPI003C2BBFE6
MYDAEGRPIPRLRSKECGALEFSFLSTITESIIKSAIPKTPWLPGLPDGLTSAFRLITTSTPLDGQSAYEEIKSNAWGLSSDQINRLFGDIAKPASELFRISVKVLSEAHILCALIPEEPGTECIVKIDSDLPNIWESAKGKPWTGLPRLFGWQAWNYKVALPAADQKSYHYELWTPRGVSIDPGSQGVKPTPPEPHIGHLGRHAFHLAAHDFPGGREYTLSLRLRARIIGWVSATFATGLAVLTLLFIGVTTSSDLVAAKATRLPVSDEAGPSSPLNLTVLFTTIFLAVGAAAVTILARSSEKSHALDDKMLGGLRFLSWGIPVVCFAAVLVLFCIDSRASMETGFKVLLWVHCGILFMILAPVAIRSVIFTKQKVTAMRARDQRPPRLSDLA